MGRLVCLGVLFLVLVVQSDAQVSSETVDVDSETVLPWSGFEERTTDFEEDDVLLRPHEHIYGAKVGVLVYSRCEDELHFPLEPFSSDVVGIKDGCIFTCTGFLVSEKHVVTAGHCFAGNEDMLFLPATSDTDSPLRGRGFSFSSKRPFGIGRVVQRRLVGGRKDVALLTLDRPLGFLTGFFDLVDEVVNAQNLTMYSYPATLSCAELTGDLQWHRTVSVTEEVANTFESDVMACPGDSGAPTISDGGEVTGLLLRGSAVGGCGKCGAPNTFHHFFQQQIDEIMSLVCNDGCRCDGSQSCQSEAASVSDIWDANREDSADFPTHVISEDDDQPYIGGPVEIQLSFINVGKGKSSPIFFDLYLATENDHLVAYEQRSQQLYLGTFRAKTTLDVGDTLIVKHSMNLPTEGFLDKETLSVFALYSERNRGLERDDALSWAHIDTFQVKGGPGNDECPTNRDKWKRGVCGCEEQDIDSDEDGVLDCFDECPFNSQMTILGVCGCKLGEDCEFPDYCPHDGNKSEPGVCGCGFPDVDSDADGLLDCEDGCPLDRFKTDPGRCGCQVPETDGDGDGVPDCVDANNEKRKVNDVERGGSCFPAEAAVEVRGRGTTPISQLQIGDFVLSADGAYSEVFFFSHRDPSLISEFLRLETDADLALELSPSHLIPARDGLAAAREVNVGDALQIGNGSLASVTAVSKTWRRGLYNPHTFSDMLVVDGVVVSCYTEAVLPVLAKVLLYPLRLLYRLGIRDCWQGALEQGAPGMVRLLHTLRK